MVTLFASATTYPIERSKCSSRGEHEPEGEHHDTVLLERIPEAELGRNVSA
jgi:hypothetical protein